MERNEVLEQVRNAVSAEEQREAFARLREYVQENPGDREATEILQQLNEGEFRDVQERLSGTEGGRRRLWPFGS